MAVLQVNNLKKGFGSTDVLKDVSFSLEQGQVLAIIGSSGSGKTKLLRCLNFLETADGGEIIVNGKQLLSTSEDEIRKNRLHFGLVFQNFNLFPQYTVLENITLAPKLLKQGTAREIEAKAMALLEQVGLAHKRDSYPYQLSGGQQQRVSIARALAMHPRILFFDEPTSALDPELTGEILKVIRDLAAENMTMVIVTHEMSFARDVSDHIVFMDGGNIVEQGGPEIISHPTQERTIQFLSRFAQ